LADLRAAGATIYVEAVDVSDYSALHKLASRFGQDLPAIDAIIHAAGVSEFCPVTELSRNGLDKLCRAKISGSWNLHRISEEFPVNHFILYSSIASVWGSANLAHYSAANGFLDALAEYRHAQNLPAAVINWGPWAKVGMAARDAKHQVESLGLLPLAPDALTNVYHRMFSFPDSSLVVCNLDVARFQAAIEVRHAVPLLAPIFDVARTEETVVHSNKPLPYSDLNTRDRTQAIQHFLQEQLAKMLNFSAGKMPGIDDPIHQLGVDSLMAVDLTSILSSHFQQRLPATLIFDYPSIRLITKFIHSTVYPQDVDADDVLNPDMEAELLKALQDFSIDLLDEVTDNI
jgi:NAD(P)-dependent dehydrogenase (short-subunit alcohol dehydrogenase family)/acyl carrier protein